MAMLKFISINTRGLNPKEKRDKFYNRVSVLFKKGLNIDIKIYIKTVIAEIYWSILILVISPII